MAAQLTRSIEHARRALRGERVFVEVRGHARDARHGEVEVRYRVAELLDPRQHEATHARVHVAEDLSLLCELRDLADRIDHALRVRRRRAHEQDGVVRDRGLHRARVGAKRGVGRRVDGLHAEVVRGLLKCGVHAEREHHLGLLDVWAIGARPIPRSLDRHQDALTAAAGHGPGDARVPKQVARHSDDLGLEPLQARKRKRVESVLGEVFHERVMQDLEHIIARPIDETERAAVSPVCVVGARDIERSEQWGLCDPFGRDFHG